MCLCRMRRWVTESLLRKCCDCTTKTFTTSGTYGILQSVLLALRTEDGMEQQEHIQKLADEYYEEGRASVSYRITCNNGNQRTLINP